MQTSEVKYNKRWEEGYGLEYPDGHIIRLCKRYVFPKITKKDKRALDFGCWNGTHTEYIRMNGYASYGIDVTNKPIAYAKTLHPYCIFYPISNSTDLIDLYRDVKFDFILANQSLYFVPDPTFDKRLHEFYSLLSNDGVIIATMMSRQNVFAKHSKRKQDNGLEEIELAGGNHYVRFIDDYEQLESTFHMFKPLMLGWYGHEFNGEVGHHWIFVGVKLEAP